MSDAGVVGDSEDKSKVSGGDGNWGTMCDCVGVVVVLALFIFVLLSDISCLLGIELGRK